VCRPDVSPQPQARSASVWHGGAAKIPSNSYMTNAPNDEARALSTAMSSKKRVEIWTTIKLELRLPCIVCALIGAIIPVGLKK